MVTKNLQINLRTPVSKFIPHHRHPSPWDQIAFYIDRNLSSSLRRRVTRLWSLPNISISEWSSSGFAFLKSCLSNVSESLHPGLRLCPRGWKQCDIWAKGRVLQYSEHTRFLSNASIACWTREWRIQGLATLGLRTTITAAKRQIGQFRTGEALEWVL